MLTERVLEWERRGSSEDFGGHSIHVFRRQGEGPLLVLLHGFPSSSYDWRLLLERMPTRNVLAFDFLGFGLTDKPREHDYSLFWQADLTEELVRRHGDGRPVSILAHDMGTSVANELMARDLEGKPEMEIDSIVLFNGSMVLEAASPTPAQRALRSRLGPLVARLSSERFFRHQFGSVFSAAHPLSDEEAEDQWSLICHKGGRSLGHRHDLLHGPARRARRALARRDPRLAGRPATRLGPAGPGRNHSGPGGAARAASAGPGERAARPRPLPADRRPAETSRRPVDLSASRRQVPVRLCHL